ncbi:hypothetical protein DYB25_011636 [Aphanomyces astaci]|uniref:glucan endo-1,3-beta-D-glucosidase n=1 Tax=Aphanomyces astaci TaxID=112090 RepID=A0A397EH51_APHAT|nr:hypothetical protein DYB25_011636 [Aphanomyces astaci]RHY88669.1 hypothetical protein DYB31_013076 [Aphanomyces astaci]
MEPQFRQLAPVFSSVRTFVAQAWNQNAADVAARSGLTVALGLWIQHGNYENEITNAIDGALRNPGTVDVIYVGNEELLVGWTPSKLLPFILDAKRRVQAAGLVDVKVGTVQIDRDFYMYPEVVGACDVIGVNIHPFFNGAPAALADPFQSFANHFSWLADKYGRDKVRMTETGFPSAGGGNLGHVASYETATAFFQRFQTWTQVVQTPTPYYFMLQDTPAKLGFGSDFEAYFGLLNNRSEWKYPMPSTDRSEAVSIFTSRGQALIVLNDNVYARRPTHSINEKFTYNAQTQQFTSLGNNQCLDAYRDDGAPGGFKVHTYACDPNNLNQKWTFGADNYLYHASHHRCLDVDVNVLQLWPCHDHNVNRNQWFSHALQVQLFTSFKSALASSTSSGGLGVAPLVTTGGAGGEGGNQPPTQLFWWNSNTKALQSDADLSQCVDAYAATSTSFQVHMYPCDASNGNQKWKLDAVTHRVFHLTHAKKCLNVVGTSSIELVDCINNNVAIPTTQRFSLDRVGECAPVEQNVNFHGQDIFAVDGAVPADCCAPCQAHPACHAYTHSNGRCYLKKLRQINSTGLWPGATSAAVQKCAPLQRASDFSGNDVGSVVAPRAEDCCAHCQLNVNCLAFTWVGGVCYLKSGVGTIVINSRATSATVV